MATEIERKFLVNRALWDEMPKPPGIFYRQGYILSQNLNTIRVRIAGEKGFITVKGPTRDASRSEFEYEIPSRDASEILELFNPVTVEKTRFRIHFNGKLWEVDVFSGENQGLIIAEIELERRDEKFSIPAWIGEEVTEDQRYYNSNLAHNPFCKW